jgi:site-specific recombinase XerD
MATVIAVRFTGKILQDGTCPVMLKVQKGTIKKHYSLGFSADEKQWDNTNRCFVRDKRVNPSFCGEDENGKKIEVDGYSVRNSYIDRKRFRAIEIIDEFEKNNIDWTLQMFEDKFTVNSKKSLLIDYLKYHIKRLKEEKRFGDAKSYKDLEDMLFCFQKDKKIRVEKLYFQDFGYETVRKFYLYLKNDREISMNSIGYYFRSLRAIMNFAIKDGCGSKDTYCFSNKYTDTSKIFTVAKLKEETKKRYIPKDFLVKLKNTVLENQTLEYCRRLFLLSFYLYGISYIDMAKLKKTDIKKTITKDGMQISEICYERSKTHKIYSIQIRPEIQEQLDWFNENRTIVGNYLLPCITIDHQDENLTNHINNRRKQYSNGLKKIARLLEFPEVLLDISTYYSRHSYAMAMLAGGRSTETISQALGHEDLKTTKIYLDSFSSDFLANESDGLI